MNELLKKPLRRQSILNLMKREPLKNEKFLDIQLKPVIKEKAEPQTAAQAESLLQKVKSFDCGVRNRDEANLSFCVSSLPLNCEEFNLDDYFTVCSIF